MPAPFAALEAKVNASVFARLANATASFSPAGGGGGGVDGVEVIFDAARATQDEATGVIVQRPELDMPVGSAPGLAPGWEVAVEAAFGSGDYLVRQVLPLAEGGWQRVVLATAA